MQKTVPIPKFVIDLSQPPELRYAHVVAEFRSRLDDCDLAGLFHDLLRAFLGRKLGKCLAAVARVAFRRVYMAEESAELAGIAKASGVPMHILVAYNVLLDLLLGCTSGGVRTLDENACSSSPDAPPTRMLHFRTLDWGMEQLRQIIVELDFVRFHGGPVVATSVTYLGYVGVLTGVRKGLSMSLNFRPHHERGSWRQRASFRWQQAMVVLGRRQSICSVLRDCLLKPAHDGTEDEKYVEEVKDDYVQAILSNQSTSPSTAAYLVFCTPERVYIVEKDHRSAAVRESDTFLTAYNHDASDEVGRESTPESESGDASPELEYLDVAYSDAAHSDNAERDDTSSDDVIGMEDLIEFSIDRKDCLDSLWKKRVQACQEQHDRHDEVVVALNDVKMFLEADEINNDETHYAVIMDPASGKVVWRTAYEVPEDSSDEDEDDDALSA